MTSQEPILYSNTSSKPTGKRRSELDDIIAESLVKIRNNSGLKQNELAKMLGIKPQMVSRYENKDSIVPFAVAYEIAAKLGIKLENFFLAENNSHVLSDNQQELIQQYEEKTEKTDEDFLKFKKAYNSIKNPEKRDDFMAIIENIVKTYQD